MEQNNLAFKVKLGEFDGPLDVLDNIIREHKLDILDLDIAKLAEQYLNFIKANIETINIDEASEYLSMATYLLELKSKRILPNEVDNIENANFEYERNKLIQRIIEFKKYKDAIPKLLKKHDVRMGMFAKQPDDIGKYVSENPQPTLPDAVNPERLLKSMQDAFEKWKFQLFTKRTITVQELAVDDIEKDILDFLEKHQEQIAFSNYLANVDELKISQQYIVTCFVALLELVKYRQINLTQKDEDIFFIRNNNKDEIQNSLIQKEG